MALTPSSPAREAVWRRHLGALVVIAAVFAVAMSGHAGHADVLPAPGWSVTTTAPLTNLVDGQRVTLHVRANADVAINELSIRECRSGVTYTTPNDVLSDTKKCPPRAVSTSSDYLVTRSASLGFAQLASSAQGTTVQFVVGSGVVEWHDAANTSLTCDPTHACTLVVELNVGSDTVFTTFPLTFTDSNPFAACGGPAKGMLTTAGSDEVADLWPAWTRDECVKTHGGAPTLVQFGQESIAVTQFARGEVDLAYTAAGYDDAVGLASVPAKQRRAAIAVPLALNASVIAAGGGMHVAVDGQVTGEKVPYPDGSLELSAGEAAALLGGGQQYIARTDGHDYEHSILARNPILSDTLYSTEAGVLAPSETLASTYFMTNYLHGVAPTEFVDPVGANPPERGATANLQTVTPSFSDVLSLQTGRPAFEKILDPASHSLDDGPIWTLTDLATARALGLTPVALTGRGGFVAPTPQTMTAAAAALTPDANGLLLPTPALALSSAQNAATAPAPYPLTYVLYALVPAQPLVDGQCNLRSASQALLSGWLRYAVGAGQQRLPEGFVALPPALLAQAKAQIARVGASPLTGACANANVKKPQTHPKGSPVPTGTNTTTPPVGSASLPSANVPGTNTPTPIASSTPAATPIGGSLGTEKPGASGGTRARETAVTIPPFAGHDLAGPLGAALALIGIALIVSLAVWLTANGLGAAGWQPRRVARLTALWAGVGVTAFALVAFQLGPFLQQRDQRALLARYRVTIDHAVNLDTGPFATPVDATQPPELASPVGVLEIGALKLQQVVLEGAQPGETVQGPGHVPGTAGLGQPGNSVVVARRNGFGGVFAHLANVRPGDPIVVTTTQGQSVYTVSTIRHTAVGTTPSDSSNEPGLAASVSGRRVVLTAAAEPNDVYAPTNDNRLTLITAAERAPWNSSQATVVVATMVGNPFAATAQGARTTHDTGFGDDGSAWPAALLAVLALAGACIGSVVLYRRLQFRTAYVITVAPLVALTVVAGQAATRLFPAWM